MRYLLTAATLIAAACSPSLAGIRIVNDGRSTLYIYVMGVRDTDWRKPVTVQPQQTVSVDIPPGRYYVMAQKPDKSYNTLGWQDYSDNRIVYRVSLCMACQYIGPTGTVVEDTQVLQPAVYHARGTYKCPTCGQFHTRWEPGWKAGDVNSGRVDQAGHVAMEQYVESRIGVTVADGPNGAIVTESFENAPSRNLRPIEGDQTKRRYLEPGRAVITAVNGKPTPTAREFLKAIRESGHRVELDVSSVRGQIKERYWTDLSEKGE